MSDHWGDITELYDALSTDWFQAVPAYTKVTLLRLYGKKEDTDAYRHDANTIQVIAPADEIDSPDPEPELRELAGLAPLEDAQRPWPAWKQVLVHEVMHEYEKKVILHSVTEEGRKLYVQFRGRNFLCEGEHGEPFHTAIVDRARNYFHMSATELRERL